MFRDTLAPIHAVMKVREGLANRAVAGVCDAIYENGKDCLCEARKQDAKLQIVEIEDRTFGLPLGWKLSNSMLDLVSWMVGAQKDCLEDIIEPKCSAKKSADSSASSEQKSEERKQRAMVRNSCVHEHVRRSLAGK